MNTYRIEISIYGANSGRKRSIVTSIVVKADDTEGAIQAALSRADLPNLTREDIFSVGLA